MVAQDVLARIDDPRLRVHLVWMPVLLGDDREAALDARRLVADPRVTHYWDEDRVLGSLWGEMLELPPGRGLAWDVYLVFAPGVSWGDRPPSPTTWMHQLAPDERHLDGDALRATIVELLSQRGSAHSSKRIPSSARRASSGS